VSSNFPVGGMSTARFYDRASSSMSRLTGRAEQLNAQVATQKRLQAPSDDASAYRRLAGLAIADADDGAYKTNLTLAAGQLQSADSTLTTVVDQIQRASELAVRGNNGTLNAADRSAIADELDQILATLAGLANADDTNGNKLFGGTDGGPGAVKQPDGSYLLATTTPTAIPVAGDQSVQASDSAAKVFGFEGRNGPTDALAAIAALSAALREPTFDPEKGDTGVADLSAASNQVEGARASLGARAARVDILQNQQLDRLADRDEVRSTLEGSTPADQAAAITELQKTMTVLQATQASFAKLQSLSLFDYLR